MHPAEAQVFDQCSHVFGKAGDAVAFARLVRAAVTADVDGDHPVVRRQLGDLVFPVAGTRAQAMHQQHRRALAVLLVVQLATVVIEVGHG
ncbi:hypothetical protein D3C71_1674300 [compost metagenome]